ncbi:hypothetical protein JCM14076_28050 [Methylosoma difficile]
MSEPTQNHPAKLRISDSSLLVPLAKSKKLQALTGQSSPKPLATAPAEHSQFPDLKPDVAAQLRTARALIDQQIAGIVAAYPPAMKNRLFKIRYGSLEAIKAQSIKQTFKNLNLDANRVDMRLLAGLDYFGKPCA